MHFKRIILHGLWVITLSCNCMVAHASAGDMDSAFRMCAARCESTGCVSLEISAPDQTQRIAACPQLNDLQTPYALLAFHWTCRDDCRYHCMMARKQQYVGAANGHHVKFYGKWPFRRILGMQEVFSVLFSLANMAVHIQHLCRLTQAWQSIIAANQASHTMYWGLWMLYASCAVNSWFWSAVFHSRDTYITERLDYISADVSVFVGLYVSVVCTLGRMNITKLVVCAVPVYTVLAVLVYHMLFVKFDYGLNVIVCLLAGVVQQLLWCTWTLYQRHPGTKQLFTFVLLINIALALEVFDFPPVGELLDAHALWHLCTVPLTYLWYAFVFCDAHWRFQTLGKQQAAVKSQ